MYRGLGAGGCSTTVVVVVVVVEGVVVVVVEVGVTVVVVGALTPAVTSGSGSAPTVEEGEHPENKRTIAAKPTSLTTEAPNNRRTESPYLSMQASAALARVRSQYAPIRLQLIPTQHRAAAFACRWHIAI